MAVITLPSSEFRRVTGVPSSKSKVVNVSPYTMQRQVQVYSGEDFPTSFELPPLAKTEALLWIKALRDLEIANNSFTLNMSDYLSSDVSDRATFSYVLVPGSSIWERETDGQYRISFQAVKNQ